MTFQVWGITDVCLAEPIIIETPLNEFVTIIRTPKKRSYLDKVHCHGLDCFDGGERKHYRVLNLDSTVWNNYSEFSWIFSVQNISKQATKRSWSSPATVMLSKNFLEHVSRPGVRGEKTGWERIRKKIIVFLLK